MMSWAERKALLFSLALMMTSLAPSADAADNTTSLQTVNSYADLADLALGAPVVAEVEIKRTARLKESLSPGIPTGYGRYFVTADVTKLIASPRPLPSSISYLVDMPLDKRGKLPKIKGEQAILFLKSGNVSDQFVLTTRHSQIAKTPEANQTIRAILTEANANARKFRITGVANGFHVPGTIPGESETQIFLSTSDQRPVSISVLRRPGEVPSWSVSLDEMLDETSRPVGRNSLLWYRLACFLPAQIPESVLSRTTGGEAQAIFKDYAFVLEQLGPCGRRLPQS